MSNKVLLVEDSKEIHQLVQGSIGPYIDLDWAQSVEEAQSFLDNTNYDLLLLDIELPDGSGLNLCSELHLKNPELAIFFLTAHDDLSEKVLGFSAGADDYITKPFNPLELKARIEAKLKKLDLIKQSNSLLKWKEISIDTSSQDVQVLSGSQLEKIELTALEFKLLTYFATRPGEVIDRDTMLNEIWGEDIHVYSRSVDTHVSKLRKKLGPVSHIIESVHGAGYKFNPSNI